MISWRVAVPKACIPLLAALALFGPGQARAEPEITPSLKKMLEALPIHDAKDELKKMVGDLRQTSCGGKLTGCYATHSGPLHLYFFTSGQTQQTFLVVVDKTFPLPKLLKDKVQKVMGDTYVSSPIISISTTDFDLDTIKMPPELQAVVRDQYFNVNTLSFSSGVQLAARANLGGAIKTAMESFGVKANQMTMRAAVVMPIPTDLAGAAGAGAGAAAAMKNGDTMKKAGADAARPETFVEFQFGPNARLPLRLPPMDLTDATFFLNNELVFGYKGNAIFKGVPNKKVLIHFQTPLSPEGAMDLLDFQFRMATPPDFTLEDHANMMVAMASPDARLARYGGGFIRNIESFKKQLLAAAKPLSVFQLRNPKPYQEYRFGDSSKPFPSDPNYFNVALLGPLVKDGPLMMAAGDVVVLGQKMGALDASAGLSGFNGMAMEDLSLKLGPLGKVTLQKMLAEAVVDKSTQRIRLKGNFNGQVVEVTLSGTTLAINVPANCVNPFEIKTSMEIKPDTNIASVFDAQGGANVDPAKIGGCVGKALEAAYNKIATEYKSLGGYSATAANAELKKISDAAAAELKKQEEAARKDYEKAKNAARDAANKSTNAANSALKAADNAFKGFGKRKKHKKGPDPKFASSVFDWDYYYDNAPDVVKAGQDLSTHWRDHGLNEGRRASLEFDVKYYRSRYLDVQALCRSTDYQCVLQHWLDYGIEQGRQGSADFSVLAYLNRYPDLQRAFGVENYPDAIEHWMSSGSDEGRNGRPDDDSDGPVSGPERAGGGGGGDWSDLASCQGRYINKFRVRSGSRVDGLQFGYFNLGWAPAHGYQGGTPRAEVALAAGEYIVRVDYRSGSAIDSISFTTNLGKTYGPYGGGGGSAHTYTVTPGQKLGCMRGRSGSSIDQLTFSSTGPR